MSEIKPVYQTVFIATEFPDGWHEVDKQVHDVRANHPDQFNTRILYPATAYEALQKENAQWKTTLDCNERIRAAQAKRIAELEETNGLLQTQAHCLEMVATSKD